MKKLIVFAIFALCAASLCFASTETAEMAVSANLIPTVVVEASSMNFGDWYIEDDPKSATATINVTASLDLVYNVTLDGGLYDDDTYRYMKNGEVAVPYQLFKADLSTEWGDLGFAGTFVAGSSVEGTGTGSAVEYTVYGLLRTDLAPADAPVGLYEDTVVVTVNY